MPRRDFFPAHAAPIATSHSPIRRTTNHISFLCRCDRFQLFRSTIISAHASIITSFLFNRSGRHARTYDHQLRAGFARDAHESYHGCPPSTDKAEALYAKLKVAKPGIKRVPWTVFPMESLHATHRTVAKRSLQVPTMTTVSAQSVRQQFELEQGRVRATLSINDSDSEVIPLAHFFGAGSKCFLHRKLR